MAHVKSAAQAMSYERTGTTGVKDVHAMSVKLAERLSTPRLIWILVKRHKVGLLALGNIILVLNWSFPEWPTFVRSLFNFN